jgi:hypothetical protein
VYISILCHRYSLNIIVTYYLLYCSPFWQGEAEATLSRTPLATERHKLYFSRQQWRTASTDALAIGHLAHQSPLFMKISPKNVAFERELVMGEWGRGEGAGDG